MEDFELYLLKALVASLKQGESWAAAQIGLGDAYKTSQHGNRSKALGHAISCYEAALRVHTETDFPAEWARAQSKLSLAYSELAHHGSGVENLKRAIDFAKAALQVFTERDFPFKWAATQNNLGNYYARWLLSKDLPPSNDVETLRRAVACYETALRVSNEKDFPAEWAATQQNLGKLCKESQHGDRSDNLSRAIACYEASLRVYTKKDFPLQWAKAKNILGTAHKELAAGSREENLIVAIACHEAALEVYTEKDYPIEWAETQDSLGIVYKDLTTGERGENSRRAIACHEAALRVCTEKAFPVEWARIQNNLGVANWNSPSGDRSENSRAAIACYEAALRVYTEQDFPVEWAITQNNLGNAYQDLLRGDRGENLNRAIACFAAALRVRAEQDLPVEWAATQYNLGNAHQLLPRGDRGENLRRAIACYEASLRVRTEKDYPVEWAATQQNLGDANSDLPRGDRSVNLQRAISYYEAALRVRNEKNLPVEWALTQNNLAAAYLKLSSEDDAEYLSRVIDCCEAALRVYTERDFPAEWARTKNNLGVAYGDLPSGDRARNLSYAISSYEATLRVYTETDFAVEWAKTQVNLGNAHMKLPSEEREQNVKLAIGSYEASLRVLHERNLPIPWAGAQNNLGNAYSVLPGGDRGANLQRAIACYEAALRVHTPEHLPIGCQQTLDNLGNLHFNEHDYDGALSIFGRSIDVTECIRIDAMEDAERRRIRSGSELTFERSVFSAIQTRRYATALTVAERGKTRNLADHLWRLDQKPLRVAPEEWRLYQDHLARATVMERTIRSEAKKIEPHAGGPGQSRSISGHQSNEHQDQVAMLEVLAQVRCDIRTIENQFAKADPDYTPFAKPLGLSEILALARESEAVIVDFRVFNSGTYAFLAGPSDSDITGEQVIELPDLTNDTLFHFVSDWLISPYTGKEWMTSLAKACGRIYQIVFQSMHARLRERYPDLKRLILIPSRGLTLLPLHAAQWESEGKTRYLLDEYEISYAPSCHVLQRCLARQRENPAVATSLLAVQNPDGSLPFSDWEVEGAAQHFSVERRTILPGAEATGGRVRESLEFGQEKLFSCHGYFDIQEVQNSYLALHGGDRLSLANIVPGSLRATSLVVLSACMSGLSDVFDRQDEYNGLPAAFLLGGAQTVISTMFSVGDLPTALLSQRFHENLYKRKMAKASALREAQLWLRDLNTEDADALLRAKQHHLATGTYTRIRSQWDLITQRMSVHDSVKARFDLRQRGTHPFANPAHWAGFYCVGAGW